MGALLWLQQGASCKVRPSSLQRAKAHISPAVAFASGPAPELTSAWATSNPLPNVWYGRVLSGGSGRPVRWDPVRLG